MARYAVVALTAFLLLLLYLLMGFVSLPRRETSEHIKALAGFVHAPSSATVRKTTYKYLHWEALGGRVVSLTVDPAINLLVASGFLGQGRTTSLLVQQEWSRPVDESRFHDVAEAMQIGYPTAVFIATCKFVLWHQGPPLFYVPLYYAYEEEMDMLTWILATAVLVRQLFACCHIVIFTVLMPKYMLYNPFAQDLKSICGYIFMPICWQSSLVVEYKQKKYKCLSNLFSTVYAVFWIILDTFTGGVALGLLIWNGHCRDWGAGLVISFSLISFEALMPWLLKMASACGSESLLNWQPFVNRRDKQQLEELAPELETLRDGV